MTNRPPRGSAPFIPPLEPGCGSWVASRIATGEVIGEFYSKKLLARFNPATVKIETAMQYLKRLNRR